MMCVGISKGGVLMMNAQVRAVFGVTMMVVALAACSKPEPTLGERIGKNIDHAVEKTGDGLERAGKAVEKAAHKTGEAVENAAQKTGQAVKGATQKTGEALQRAGESIQEQSQ